MLFQHINLSTWCCRLAECFYTVPFKLDRRLRYIGMPATESKAVRNTRYAFMFSTVLALLQGLYVLGKIKYNPPYKINLFYQLTCQYNLMVQVTTLVYMMTFLKHAKSVAKYVNGILEFHRNYLRKTDGKEMKAQDRSTKQKFGLMFARIFFPNCLLHPLVFVIGLHWSQPCKPSLMGYWMLEECSFENNTGSSSILGFAVKILVFLANMWIWTIVVSLFLLGMGLLPIQCTLSLVEYIKKFQKLSLNQQTNIRNTTLIYRKLQVLALLMNEIQAYGITDNLIFIVVVAQTVGLCTLINLFQNGINTISAWFLLTLYVVDTFNTTIFIVVIFGIMADVWELSNEAVNNLAIFTRVKYTDAKITRSEFKMKQIAYQSFNTIKVKFGSLNCLDRLTPLTCLRFVNELTINILLIC